jgi:hypothetical protein
VERSGWARFSAVFSLDTYPPAARASWVAWEAARVRWVARTVTLAV